MASPVKWPGWKIHRPAYCFASVIVWTENGQSILRKIFKFVATRWHLLRLKCTKFDFGCPDPAGGAYSAPPDPIAGFEGPTSKGWEGEGWEWGEGRGNLVIKWRGGEGKRGMGGGWPDLAWGLSDLEMTWLLYCAGTATDTGSGLTSLGRLKFTATETNKLLMHHTWKQSFAAIDAVALHL